MELEIKFNRIKGLMKENGDTQQTLAEALGITETTLINYLHGRREMKLTTLNKIAKRYNVAAADLLQNKG